MTWIEPKTDWEITDSLNIEDFNRINGNIKYLIDNTEKYFGSFEHSDMPDDISDYSGAFYADDFNAFEDNLDAISNIITSLDIGDKQTFFDNSPFITASELNRIEVACAKIKGVLDRVRTNKLPYRLGTYKSMRV